MASSRLLWSRHTFNNSKCLLKNSVNPLVIKIYSVSLLRTDIAGRRKLFIYTKLRFGEEDFIPKNSTELFAKVVKILTTPNLFVKILTTILKFELWRPLPTDC